MKARIYDSCEDYYFISEVLAIINIGYYEKYLVMDSKADNRLKLIDFLDKKVKTDSYGANVNIIDYFLPDNWISRKVKKKEDCNRLLDTADRDRYIFSFRGYEYFSDNLNIISDLILGKEVFSRDISFFNNLKSSDIEGWSYLRSQNDIDDLMKRFHGFHDSVLVDASYTSGSYVDNDNAMYCMDTIRTMHMKFDSQWSDSIELVFSGVLDSRLKPAEDNYTSNLFDASIILKDETIYFFTAYVKEVDESFNGTWIKSLEVRWRYV